MKTVIIVKESLDEHLSPIISSVFDSVQVIHSDEDVLSLIYMDPPDIILIDRTYLQEHDGTVVNEFRSNTIYGHLPVVAIYTEKDIENPSALDIPLDDFIVLSDSELQIKRRIEFTPEDRCGRWTPILSPGCPETSRSCAPFSRCSMRVRR